MPAHDTLDVVLLGRRASGLPLPHPSEHRPPLMLPTLRIEEDAYGSEATCARLD
ncbi:MAG: hypothetical protein M3198_17030 [Actinomycetota bacterium]|nr:hypothetical protein [Actinomycetota bacterium]